MGKVDATIPDYSGSFVESIIVAPLQPPTSLETLDRSDPNALPITSSTEETSDLAEKTVIHAAEGDERNEPQDVPSNVDLPQRSKAEIMSLKSRPQKGQRDLWRHLLLPSSYHFLLAGCFSSDYRFACDNSCTFYSSGCSPQHRGILIF
ncbi:hypothetical protein YC2023_056714 [Brassica napus]